MMVLTWCACTRASKRYTTDNKICTFLICYKYKYGVISLMHFGVFYIAQYYYILFKFIFIFILV